MNRKRKINLEEDNYPESADILQPSKRFSIKDQLSEARLLKSDEPSTAAEVVRRSGKFIGHQIGRFEKDKILLTAEETLHLLETKRLWLRHENVPLSLQSAYQNLLDTKKNLDFAKFGAYSYLNRLGYKLRRHKPENLETVVKIENETEEITIIDETSWRSCEKRAKLFSTLIPNYYGKRKILIPAPSKDLLPFGSWPRKSIYVTYVRRKEDEISSYSEKEFKPKRLGIKNELCEKCYEDSREIVPSSRGLYIEDALKPSFDEGQVVNPRPWGSRKCQHKTQEENSPSVVTNADDMKALTEGKLSVLWRNENGTRPLMMPCQAKSLKSIYQAIRLTGNQKIGKTKENPSEISYDYYSPNNAGNYPSGSLKIINSKSEESWKELFKDSEKFAKYPVSVMVAKSSEFGGNISFASLQCIDLPSVTKLYQ